MLQEILKFNGKWRSYQERVLTNAHEYAKDGKIHIVAAPGSGKTTLGIELIKRKDEPVLILAPSITIREQWKNRIENAFLNKWENVEDWVSQDLQHPRAITIATYQALHSAMHKYKGIMEEDEGKIKENVDYSSFDLITTFKKIGVNVLCLDECHHLRSEWWKSLEEYKKKMNDPFTIALTATPPYDSQPQAWKRYIDMCGEIDEEITIPELVKEGSLCPHQDYVYFNYPTKEELVAVKEFQRGSLEIIRFFISNDEFEKVVCSHPIIKDNKDASYMLENPSYVSSIIIYLNAKGIPMNASLRKLLGTRKIPELNTKWMEILLQNVLYDAIDDFVCEDTIRQQWIKILKQNGFIEKGKIILSINASVEKMLIQSQAKINSIIDIVECEYQSLQDDLRLLVLTDYIRKEQEKIVGTDIRISNLGVLPFFETLRRHFENKKQVIHLCILCGSLVVIPTSSKDKLIEICGEYATKLNFTKLGQLSIEEYVKVEVQGNQNFLTNAITELFNQGYIHVMVGTKSLLGEGWDSPCINSLILASFVGSFMLSNQMRGRAIRVMKGNPNKTSNIWHLVCVKPPSLLKKETIENADTSISEDWELLERRFQHFLGLHYKEDLIEDGIERLNCIQFPFTKRNIEQTNKEMLKLATKRNELQDRWDHALAILKNIEVIQETKVKSQMAKSLVFYDSIAVITVVALVMLMLTILTSVLGIAALYIVLRIMYVLSGVLLGYVAPKIFKLWTPYKRLEQVGKAITKAMQEMGYLKDEIYHVQVEQVDGLYHSIYLKGGSQREKELFTKCVMDFYAPMDNQRYILVKAKGIRGKYGYYCVPELFSINKESALIFEKNISKIVGNYRLIYTRSANGRKELLKGRAWAYANQQERLESKKKIKSAWE